MRAFAPLLDRIELIRSLLHPSVAVRVPKHSEMGMIRTHVFFGTFEAAEIRALRFGPPAFVPVVELGSGIGVIASHVLRRKRVSSYTALEANPDLISVCLDNMERNNHRGVPISVVNAAILDGDLRQAALVSPVVEAPTYLGNRVMGCSDESKADGISVLSLKDVAGGHPEYSLICDIEGAERSFILGEDDSLERCVWLCAELHSDVERSLSVNDLVDGIVASGLRIVYRDGSVVVASRSRPCGVSEEQPHQSDAQ